MVHLENYIPVSPWTGDVQPCPCNVTASLHYLKSLADNITKTQEIGQRGTSLKFPSGYYKLSLAASCALKASLTFIERVGFWFSWEYAAYVSVLVVHSGVIAKDASTVSPLIK